MNRYQEEYNRKKMSARQVLENIQSRDFVFTPTPPVFQRINCCSRATTRSS